MIITKLAYLIRIVRGLFYPGVAIVKVGDNT